MKVLDWVHVFAGIMVVLGTILTVWVHPAWAILTAFVGLNLAQFGVSGFCPFSWMLKKCGVPDGSKALSC